MMHARSYRIAFVSAICVHLAIALLLLAEPKHDKPVMALATQTMASQPQPAVAENKPQAQAIKAVSVDSQQVMQVVQQLKQEKIRQQQAQARKQQQLAQQAEAARKQRIEEQQRVEKLKAEAAKLAIAREKQLAEEQLRLKKLAKQKAAEEKRLVEIKALQQALEKKQKEEAEKLAALEKKKADALAQANQEKAEKAQREKAEQARADKERAEKAQAELAKRQQAAVQQAALEAQRNAQVAGEVDKYKAMIINAISQQWIVPENANKQLSSQFRIRLAPNGSVLEVTLTRSSGDPVLDRSAQSAIYKASPLPVPADPAVFDIFRDISLTVRPESARG